MIEYRNTLSGLLRYVRKAGFTKLSRGQLFLSNCCTVVLTKFVGQHDVSLAITMSGLNVD